MDKVLVLLSAEQVRVASYIHDELMPQWAESDRRLDELRARRPGLDEAAALEKARAINRYYFARHPSPPAAARRIAAIMQDPPRDPIEIVECIAPLEQRGQVRYYFSFASKFGHFFIDPERIPIYDAWALEAIKYHFGHVPAERSRMYRMFAERVYQLREASGLSCSLRELDRYLWLSGMYRAWIAAADPSHLGLSSEVLTVFRDYGHIAGRLLGEAGTSPQGPYAPLRVQPNVSKDGTSMSHERVIEQLAHWPCMAKRRLQELLQIRQDMAWELQPIPCYNGNAVTFNRRRGQSTICFRLERDGRVYIKFVDQQDAAAASCGSWRFTFRREGPDNYYAVATAQAEDASVRELQGLLAKAYDELRKRP